MSIRRRAAHQGAGLTASDDDPGFEAGPASAGDDAGSYRIDALSELTGISVRNIREYQDRGLLPPPQRVGRVAIYQDDHVVRLRLIERLLQRGYTIAAVPESPPTQDAGLASQGWPGRLLPQPLDQARIDRSRAASSRGDQFSRVNA